MRPDIPEHADLILGDATQINQVVINLCTNAAQAMEEEGGILDIRLRTVSLDEVGAARYPDITPGRYVNVTVKDTGGGIAPDAMNRIFDPYFTTKAVGKGTGMGLAVVHGIVKRHHGSISVTSEPGKGATFALFFPAVDMLQPVEADGRGELPTGNERILFVDDEVSMAKLSRQRLERFGYSVEGVTNPKAALEMFRFDPDGFDLVITDMAMPGMSGDRLAREILKIRPEMPIILCTGYSERISDERAREIGIGKYMEKPVEMRELATSVREVLGKKGKK